MIETHLRRALLVTTLALCCVLGFLTSYVLAVIAMALLGHFIVRRRGLLIDIASHTFFFAFLALAAVFAIDARQPSDLVYLVNFIAFLTYALFSTSLARAAAPQNTTTVAGLALIGTAAGCAFAILDRLLIGAERVGHFTTDPIRLADTALILGFLCLMGVLVRTDARRWLYLLGPVLALVTIILSGSRGALVAFAPMVVLAAFLLVRQKLLAVGIGVALLAGLSLVLGFTDLLGARFERLATIAADLGSGAVIGDEGTRIRVELYKAALAAFQQSPVTGHGWAGMMPAIAPYLGEADRIHATLPHLHNELLNFAVSGGVVGILVYLALLALPVAACLRTPRDSQFRARLYGCALLTLSYFLLGIPDTMLSFELHGALYVALTAILLAYCRDEPVPRPRASRSSA